MNKNTRTYSRPYNRWIAFVGLLALCDCASGCISIEQEIFLQPDGSGDLLLHIGLPDLPEDAKKSPAGGGNPTEAMEKFKRGVHNRYALHSGLFQFNPS